MLLGHYAVAFAAKRASPRLSLGTAIAAAQLLDHLWPVFMLLAVTHIFVVLSVGPGAMGGDTFFWDSAHPASVGDWCLEFRRVLAGRRTCYDDRRPRPQSCCASPAR